MDGHPMLVIAHPLTTTTTTTSNTLCYYYFVVHHPETQRRLQLEARWQVAREEPSSFHRIHVWTR